MLADLSGERFVLALQLLEFLLQIVDDEIALLFELSVLLREFVVICGFCLEKGLIVHSLFRAIVIVMSVPKKSSEKIIEECVKILRTETNEATQKWISDSKITSLTLRNVKALEIISLSNYMLQKMLINQLEKNHQLLYLLLEYNVDLPPRRKRIIISALSMHD